MKKTLWHASRKRQLWRNSPGQFYRTSFISTTHILKSTATAPPENNYTCFSVQASWHSNSRVAEVSKPKHKSWAQAASQTAKTTTTTTTKDPQPLRSMFESVKYFLPMFVFPKLTQTQRSLILQLQTTSKTPFKIHDFTWYCCYLFFDFILIHRLRLIVWNVNSVKRKLQKLIKILSIIKTHFEAIREIKLSPKHRY